MNYILTKIQFLCLTKLSFDNLIFTGYRSLEEKIFYLVYGSLSHFCI